MAPPRDAPRSRIPPEQVPAAVWYLVRRLDQAGWAEENLKPGADFDTAWHELQQIGIEPLDSEVNDWIEKWLDNRTGRRRLLAYLRQTQHVRKQKIDKIGIERTVRKRFAAWADRMRMTQTQALEQLLNEAEAAEEAEEVEDDAETDVFEVE